MHACVGTWRRTQDPHQSWVCFCRSYCSWVWALCGRLHLWPHEYYLYTWFSYRLWYCQLRTPLFSGNYCRDVREPVLPLCKIWWLFRKRPSLSGYRQVCHRLRVDRLQNGFTSPRGVPQDPVGQRLGDEWVNRNGCQPGHGVRFHDGCCQEPRVRHIRISWRNSRLPRPDSDNQSKQ